MFRSSTRQLARCSQGLLLRPLPSPAFRAARFPRNAPAPAAARLNARFLSTTPPRPDREGDGRTPKTKNEGRTEAPRDPPPPGFVHLEEDELKLLEAFLSRLPNENQRAQMEEVFKDVRQIGVPVELRDMLHRMKEHRVGMMDALKIPKIAYKMAAELTEYNERKTTKTDFTSNKPGEQEPDTGSAGQSHPREAAEQHQQQQQQQQQPQERQPQEQHQPQEQQQQHHHHQQKQQRQQHQQPQRQQEQQGQQEEQQQQQQQRQQSQQKKHQGQRGTPPNPKTIDGSDMLTWAIAAAVLYPFYSMIFPGETHREITWQELRTNFLDKGLVEKLIVTKDRVRVELNRDAVRSMYPDSQAANPNFTYYFSIGSVDAFERKLDEAQKELGIPSSERIPVSYASEGLGTSLLLSFGPTLLLVGLLAWVSRRAGGAGGGASSMFGFGKSKAKMFNHDTAVKVKFSDVAGMDEAKVEIMEFVSFLRTPERFQRLGAKIPRGAILSGPPGTGKTLLARATAGESQVPFFSVSGSEFVEMFVGVGASRVRDLFATARKNAPCIIFIDEIDAIGKSRSEGGGFRGGGNDEREATLNQILTEMDGFNTSEQVVVLAGTNRPDILDKALMRPGRFDRHIHIDRPTMKGRQDIFKVHLAKILTKEDMEYLTGRLAALTPGFAGADIANAVNEAALIGTCAFFPLFFSPVRATRAKRDANKSNSCQSKRR